MSIGVKIMNNIIYKLGNNEDFNKQKEKQRLDIKSSTPNSQQIKRDRKSVV